MASTEIRWRAPEHRETNHSANWYWTVGAVAVAVAAGAIILENILLAVVVVVGTIALMLQTAKKPKEVAFGIQHNGVRIGNVVYRYQDLDSFAITEENILIKSKKKLMPYITIPIPEKYRDSAYELLAAYLPEDDHTEPAADKIMEELGF